MKLFNQDLGMIKRGNLLTAKRSVDIRPSDLKSVDVAELNNAALKALRCFVGVASVRNGKTGYVAAGD